MILLLLSTAKCGLSKYGKQVPSILLADDITLVSLSPRGLQTALDTVSDYAAKWRLTYNATKSQVVIFHKTGKHEFKSCFKLGSLPLQISNNVTFGGVLITSNLSSKDQIDKSCHKAKQNVNFLCSFHPKHFNIFIPLLVDIYLYILNPNYTKL